MYIVKFYVDGEWVTFESERYPRWKRGQVSVSLDGGNSSKEPSESEMIAYTEMEARNKKIVEAAMVEQGQSSEHFYKGFPCLGAHYYENASFPIHYVLIQDPKIEAMAFEENYVIAENGWFNGFIATNAEVFIEHNGKTLQVIK